VGCWPQLHGIGVDACRNALNFKKSIALKSNNILVFQIFKPSGEKEGTYLIESIFGIKIRGILKDRRLIMAVVVIVPALVVGLILAFEATVGITFLIIGLALLAISGEKAVEHSIGIATALRMSPLMIGLIVVSLGTDFPEIMNSIISSAMNHGDINVGNALGSALTQTTLVLGLFPFVGGSFKVKREEVAVMGACEVLALIASVSIVEKGYISRMNAFFLLASWPLLMLIARNVMKKPSELEPNETDQTLSHHLLVSSVGFIGVAVGAYIVVQSVIVLSSALSIPEYFVSFFIVAFGTSLPEIVIDLTAMKKKQYDIAIGDAIGSSIVDAGFSMGVGAMFFPINVTATSAVKTGLYAMLCAMSVMMILSLRQKHDRKTGLFFIMLYVLAYFTLFN
jgi:cation:H+ antiporter